MNWNVNHGITTKLLFSGGEFCFIKKRLGLFKTGKQYLDCRQYEPVIFHVLFLFFSLIEFIWIIIMNYFLYLKSFVSWTSHCLKEPENNQIIDYNYWMNKQRNDICQFLICQSPVRVDQMTLNSGLQPRSQCHTHFWVQLAHSFLQHLNVLLVKAPL